MSGKWQGGKGSDPRPTNRKKYEENWDRIFGKKELSSNPFTIEEAHKYFGNLKHKQEPEKENDK